MQNKGLIKFLAWAFALVCLYQLSFTVVTNVIQGNAKTDAKNYVNSEQVQKMVADRATDKVTAQILVDSIQNAREAHYLDSMATEKVYLGYTYRECQGREINLGLDLKVLVIIEQDLLTDNLRDKETRRFVCQLILVEVGRTLWQQLLNTFQKHIRTKLVLG